MAYDKTNWQTGDVVTAEKLNKLEDGVANASSLPSVTATDNGDVLTVVEGAWAKATPSAVGGIEFINVTENVTEDDSVYTLDKTYNEISAMVEDGKVPVTILVSEEPSSTDLYFVEGLRIEDGTYFVSTRLTEFSAETADGVLSAILSNA